MTDSIKPKPRAMPRPAALAASFGQVDAQDAPPVDQWAWHARKQACWWGVTLPVQERDASGKVVGLSDCGWWTQGRIGALVLWLGNGAVRELGAALAGTSEDRLAYAMRRAKARWVADSILASGSTDPLAVTQRILSARLPADRARQAERGAAMLEHVAELLPAPPDQCRDMARYALSHLQVVESVGSLWPPRCDPRHQVVGMDDHGPVLGTILPPRRAPIDHDARMKAAEGVFG